MKNSEKQCGKKTKKARIVPRSFAPLSQEMGKRKNAKKMISSFAF